MRLGGGIRAIARNGLGATGMTAVETLVRAAYFVAITRLVGPEGYGLYSWALALYGFVLAGASLGFETLVPYGYGKGREAGDRQASALLGLRLLFAILAALGLTVYAQLAVPGEVEMIALLAVVPALVFRGTALLNRAIFTGRMEVARNLPQVLAARLVELSVGLALMANGFGIEVLLLLHWGCWALEALLSWRSLRSRSGVRVVLPSRTEAAPLVRRGLPIGALDLSSGFLMAAPLVLYEPLARDLAELGQVGVAVQLAGFVLAAGFAFLNSAVPVLAQSREAGDRRVAHYGGIVAAIALGTTALAWLLWQVLSAPLFALVFGNDYDLARLLTGWTVLLAGAVLLPHGFQQVLLLENRYRAAIAANLLACIMVIGAFALHGARFGPVEAVQVVLAGWLLRAVVMSLAGLLVARRLPN